MLLSFCGASRLNECSSPASLGGWALAKMRYTKIAIEIPLRQSARAWGQWMRYQIGGDHQRSVGRLLYSYSFSNSLELPGPALPPIRGTGPQARRAYVRARPAVKRNSSGSRHARTTRYTSRVRRARACDMHATDMGACGRWRPLCSSIDARPRTKVASNAGTHAERAQTAAGLARTDTIRHKDIR